MLSSSPLVWSRVYWFLPSLPLLAGGLPPAFRPVTVFDRLEGGVSAWGLPLLCAALEGERLGVGRGVGRGESVVC